MQRTKIAISRAAQGAASGFRALSFDTSMVATASEVAELCAAANSPKLAIIDCSSADAFFRAHIRNAVHLGASAKLKDAYQALATQLGIGKDTDVICYDAEGGISSCRVWWTLRHYGHSRARVLADGWQGFATAYPTELAFGEAAVASDEAVAAAASAPVEPVVQADWLATFDEANRFGQTAGTEEDAPLVLDVRTAPEFAGDDLRSNERGGRIPGALNLPHATLMRPDRRWLSADEVAAQLAEAGVTPEGVGDRRVVTLCQSGQRASHTLFMLRAIGFGHVANYDGSMGEYLARAEAAVATGEPDA